MGLLHHDELNVLSPQVFWFREDAPQYHGYVLYVDHRQYRDVVRTVRDHRPVYLPGLRTQQLGNLLPPFDLEVGFYIGTFGLFFTLYFLFSKFFPVIAISEIKHILKKSGTVYKEKMGPEEAETADEFAAEYLHHDH